MGITVVAGEMATFSDLALTGCGSKMWIEFLNGLPARGGNALLVGSNRAEITELLSSRFGEVTVVVRSLPDAQELQQIVDNRNLVNISIIAGSLDIWCAENTRIFDTVIAIDGLDRTISFDRPDSSWTARLRMVTKHLRAGGTMVLGLSNQFSISALLDARPQAFRAANDDWFAVTGDITRPTAIPEFLESMADLEIPVSRLWAGYGSQRQPGALLDVVAAKKLRHDDTQTAVLGHAITGGDQPWLADPHSAWFAAVRACEADTVADFWLLATGECAFEDRYFAAGGLHIDSDGPNVLSVLTRLAECGDVPAIRAYAARLGAWAIGGVDVQRFDQLIDTQSGFTAGYGALPVGDIPGRIALAALWYGFRDLLLADGRKHPWPLWMVRDGLVESWLAAADIELTDSEKEWAAKLACEWAAPFVHPVTGDPTAIRIAQNEADILRGEVASLRELLEIRVGHIDELKSQIDRNQSRFRRRLARLWRKPIRDLKSKLRGNK